jgi:pyruvate,orthophosphate dikinase
MYDDSAPDSAAERPRYQVLGDVAHDYPGLTASTEKLYRELEKEPRDWDAAVVEIRSYALKHFSVHLHHEKGGAAIGALIALLFEALDSEERRAQEAAAETITFYLGKLFLDSGESLVRYVSQLNESVRRLSDLPHDRFLHVVHAPHQLKKMGQVVLDQKLPDFDVESFSDLLLRSLTTTYEYWLGQPDPVGWIVAQQGCEVDSSLRTELEELFYPVSHRNLNELLLHLRTAAKADDVYVRLAELLELPGFVQIVRFYESLIAAFGKKGTAFHDIKMAYLFRILESEGLSGIHEGALREIARTVSSAIRSAGASGHLDEAKAVLTRVFDSLMTSVERYPDAALTVLDSIGAEVYGLGNSHLVEWFLKGVISLGFQYPEIEGVTEEWQVRGNKAHLKNVRVWLGLIERNPKWSKSLISALKIYLRLGGVQICDTDLFQKDITKLLNSDIKPVYHFVKQLAKLFPVYFNDINAEGALRAVSVEIDDSTGRADYLVNFLRKQAHIESSARIVEFIEEIFRFWLTKENEPLRRFLPEGAMPFVPRQGMYVDELHTIFTDIFRRRGFGRVQDLLSLTEDDLREEIEKVPSVSKTERRRAFLAVRFYQLLHRKYGLGPEQIEDHLAHARYLGLPAADTLVSVLKTGSLAERLDAILGYLERLQEIILSTEQFEAVEDVFRKRHIAVGIPSLYGRYLEKKFNALSLTYRIESLANIYFDEVVESVNLNYITRATLFQIEKHVGLFRRALRLDGISSNRLDLTLELLSDALEVRRFSSSQYIDIFRGFSEAVQDILNTYYHGFHKDTLRQVIVRMGKEHILPRYLDAHEAERRSELVHALSEQFLREIVTASLGLQQLDLFFSRILKTLFMQAQDLDENRLDLLMSYDSKKALSGIHGPSEVTNDRIHLGNKGYNLVRLASLGIRVPPGFIVTTEVFRCLDAVSRFRYARDHLNECIREKIGDLERQTGRTFGDAGNPLLVSVRSGSTISMPGMMSSLLNVGLNETTVEGLIRQTGKPWFAWDCYRRYLQSWAMSFGLDRDRFDATMTEYKGAYHVERKIQFTPAQMKNVALGYRKVITESGLPVFDDPYMQLETAIAQVFLSWSSEKAKAYREILGISEHWGTAAIVQTMVYGNLDATAGTGVLFTSNPRLTSDRVTLWGDFAVGAQGEDIVSGLVKTRPISREQKLLEVETGERSSREMSLEEEFPEIYGPLLSTARELIYEQRWGAQEIEFTFEGEKGKDLYILQTRDMAVSQKETFLAFVPTAELAESYLVSGMGAGGGVLCGKVVFDLDDIRDSRKNDPAMPVILVRSDTVPDDIRHISSADGILTARGGATSHAAIIANRLGKTCVVGCSKLFVWEHEKICKINGRTIRAGDLISIDGRNGSVYLGMHEITEIKPY